MKSHLIVLAFVISMILRASAMAAVPAFVGSSEWSEVKSAHFRVITDAGSGTAVGLARKLERLCQVYARMNPELNAIPALPAQVYVFHDAGEMESYRPASLEHVAGYFMPAEDHLFLVLNGNPDQDNQSSTVCHEFTHAFVYGNFPDVPVWLNEGLAQFYQTLRIARTSVEVGKPEPRMVEWLAAQELIPLDLMFAFDPAAPAYQKDNALRNVFYAESWALTHYLITSSPDRTRKFAAFLERFRAGTRARKAFEEQFPSDTWPALIAALKPHLEQIPFLKLPRFEFTDAPEADRAGATSMARSDVLYRLGELEIALGPERRAAAREHFEAALAAQSDHAPSIAGMSYLHEVSGEAEAGERDYRRAATLAPQDARVHWLAGRGALEAFFMRVVEASTEAGVPKELLTARERFRACLELEPDNIAALGGFGRTFMMDATPDPAGVAALEKAVAALPARPDLATTLAMMHARTGGSAQAEEVVRRRIDANASSADARRLRNAIQATDLQHAEEMIRSGQAAAGESLLVEAASRTTDPDLRRAADDRIAELNAAHANAPAAELLERATAAARRGDFVETLSQAERSSATATDPEVRRHADELASWARPRVAVQRVMNLMKAGKPHDAQRALAGLDPRTLDDDLRKLQGSLSAEIDAAITIEDAMAMVRQGKLAPARAALSRVLTLPVSEQTLRYVRGRIAEIDKAMRAGH